MAQAKQTVAEEPLKVEIPYFLKDLGAGKHLIVDFDETLFLKNSTAEYLNRLQPRLLARIILKSMSILQPWRWFAAELYQDWFLVAITTVLMPWNIIIWHLLAPEMAKNSSNAQLVCYLGKMKDQQVIIATLGFRFIISPILKQMEVNSSQLIGCGFWRGLRDRKLGKLKMLESYLEPDELASATLITDSLDDLPVIKRVKHPLVVMWQDN